MSRDEARAAFAKSGLTYEDIQFESLKGLRHCINKEMQRSGVMRGTLRCRRTASPKWVLGEKWASIRCKSHYFEDREAVTFETNGFVGFAGWADDQNIQPILSGFMKWLAANAPTKDAA